jgi:hypothetical protein
MKAHGGADVEVHVFLSSALVVGKGSASRPGRFTTWERDPVTYLTGDWLGSRASSEDVEKIKFFTLQGLELRFLGRPARSQSLDVQKLTDIFKTLLLFLSISRNSK